MKQLFISLIFFISTTLWAQYSPDTVWLTIKTEHFNIIYDENINTDALEIANDLENYYLSLCSDFNGSIDRYTIVLPSELVQSNGYVNSINNHSVFYPVPPTSTSTGTVQWYKLLSVHETRHMAQNSYIRDSVLQKMLEFLFGSYGIRSAVFIPSYMFEGDAVLTETLLTDSGRGRSPSFERSLRTILLNNRNYSFSKALLLSGRDYNPNYYVLGYYLMTYLKREFGTDILPQIINMASNNPLPLNFSTASLFATGKSMPTLYKELKEDLYSKWSEQDSKVSPTDTISVELEGLSGYQNKVSLSVSNKDRFLYLERRLNSQSVLIENRAGERITHPISPSSFSIFEDSIIYSSIWNDTRWGYTEYSDIIIYNLLTGERELLTDKQRYFLPEYSNKGDKIAVIEYSLNRVPAVVILDTKNMAIIKNIPFNRGGMINGISWSDKDDLILVSRVSDSGSSIGFIDFESGFYKDVTPIDNIIKTKPVMYKNNILYVSTYSGIENINSVNIDTKEIYQVVSSRFGVDYPEVYKNELFFSLYSVDGYKIEKIKLNSDNWIPLEQVGQNHVDYFEPLLKDVVPKGDEYINYIPENYFPNKNLIDVHSWVLNPFLPNIQKSNVYNIYNNDGYFDVQELILFSTDHLEKMDVQFYTHYNNKSQSMDIGSIGIYRGFYPYISWDFNLYYSGYYEQLTTLKTNFSFEFPILMPNLFIGISPTYNENFVDGFYTYLDLSYYINYRYENYFSSASTTLNYNHSVIGTLSPKLSLTTILNVNGFFRSDNFNFYNKTQFNLDDFNNSFSSQFNVKYNIPIIYPDLSILNWIYFNKIDLDLGYSTMFSENQLSGQTTGATIFANYNLLRMPIDFFIGFEYYYDFVEDGFNKHFIPFGFKSSL